MSRLSKVQSIQESQYQYPYHYLPEFADGKFSQAKYWSWGMQYLGGLELVLSRLNDLNFKSLIDVGCGDGRFLREVNKNFDQVQLLGVDYSSSAIQLATALNPSIEYKCLDITSSFLEQKYDVATMIEVLEHIPPKDVSAFLDSVRDLISPAGVLIVTVPHVNKRLNAKHYQHFSSNTLRHVLSDSFQVDVIMPFERLSRLNNYMLKLLGYTSYSNYIITNHTLNSLLYERILSGCLNEQSENKCGRILAIAKPKHTL